MKYKVILLISLIAILVGIIIAYSKSNDSGQQNSDMQSNMSNGSSNSKSITKSKSTVLKSSSEIKSALVEQIEPHASYYLEEVYIEQNQFVEKGSNILKYTNGTYLTAPYDCVVTGFNLPETNEKILNSHYVELSSNKVLSVTVSVDEKQINNLSIGADAKISVPTLEKEYLGNVTNIASTASNGKFKVTVEFENDGDIKIGMTANVEITI